MRNNFNAARGAAVLVAVLASSAAPCLAQSASAAPAAFPAEESFVYARTTGDKRDEVRTSSRLVSAKGQSWYEIESSSSEEDILLRLDPETLLAIYTEVTSRSKDATIKRVTTLIENKAKPAADEFLVSSAEALSYSLRGFAWGARQKAKIAFLGVGGGGNFRFDLNVIGKETIKVGDRGVECWKAQLSIGGIVGSFVGKTTLWYSTAYPHYLVKSEGSMSGPGSPTRTLLLTSYSSGG